MPMFIINTNVPNDKIPPKFTTTTAELIAEILEKPIEKVISVIHADQCMMFGGTAANCATCVVHSKGKISPEENKKYAKSIGEFLQKTINVPQDRCYIEFHDQDPHMLGVLGTTGAAL